MYLILFLVIYYSMKKNKAALFSVMNAQVPKARYEIPHLTAVHSKCECPNYKEKQHHTLFM